MASLIPLTPSQRSTPARAAPLPPASASWAASEHFGEALLPPRPAEPGVNPLAFGSQPYRRAIILFNTCIETSSSVIRNFWRTKMAHELPPLPYAYDALESTIDKQTMTLHHDMH